MGRFEAFGRALDRAESPLERRFLVALLMSEQFNFVPIVGRGTLEIAEDTHGVVLGQQVPVGGFRVDFALKLRNAPGRIAVEVDGAAFHNSPEQVERDKRRDRVLVAAGWVVVRWTSRELLRDALTCAREAHELAMRLGGARSTAPLAKALPTAGQLQLRTTG